MKREEDDILPGALHVVRATAKPGNRDRSRRRTSGSESLTTARTATPGFRAQAERRMG